MTPRLKVKVKTRAGKQLVEKQPDGSCKVWVKAAPEKGRANEAVVEALSAHLNVPKSRIRIVSGHTRSNKTVEF